MLVQPQTCIGPTLHQHSTNFWDLPDRCQFNIRYRRSLLFCKCTKLKRQYVLTCKASTNCHIISARAESCEKRAYLLFATPPHCGTQSCNGGGWGGVLTMEQPVSIVYVPYTQPVKCYSTVHTTLGTRNVLKVIFSAHYANLTLLMNN